MPAHHVRTKEEVWREILANLPLYKKSYMDWVESPFGFYVERRWNDNRQRWDAHEGPIVWQEMTARVMRWAFTFDDDGWLPIDTFVDIDGGQSGKSTRQASVAQWIGMFHDRGSLLQLAANSREQSAGRVYEQLTRSLELNPYGYKIANILKDTIEFTERGNTVMPLPFNGITISGGSPLFRGIDEACNWLWTDSSRKMAAEYKPTGARNLSLLYISSYMSFKDEKGFLNDTVLEAFDEDGHPLPGTEKVPGLEDLPLYVRGLSAYWWNKNPSLYPWNNRVINRKTGTTFIQARLNDRKVSPSETRRIWFAEWVNRENTFMPMDDWSACEDPTHHPLTEKDRGVPMILCLDAGWKHDTTGGIARGYDSVTRLRPLYAIKKWLPDGSGDILLKVKQWVIDMCKRHQVIEVALDPREFILFAAELRQLGIPVVEITQNNERLTADTEYRALIADHLLRNYPECGELTDHVGNAVGQEREDGVRMSKRKSSSHIDLAVADSMCNYRITRNIRKFERLARTGNQDDARATWKNPWRTARWGQGAK